MLECTGGSSDAITQQQAMLSIQPKETEGSLPGTWSPDINVMPGSNRNFIPAAHISPEISA